MRSHHEPSLPPPPTPMGPMGSAHLGGKSRRGEDKGAIREVRGESEFGNFPQGGREVRGGSSPSPVCIGVCTCLNCPQGNTLLWFLKVNQLYLV